MEPITYRAGGAIPAKQLAALAAALGLPAAAISQPEQLRASAHVVSAWDDARLVGLGRLLGDRRTLLVLQAVVVDPTYRHHGIGSGLVRRCLAGEAMRRSWSCWRSQARPPSTPPSASPSRSRPSSAPPPQADAAASRVA